MIRSTSLPNLSDDSSSSFEAGGRTKSKTINRSSASSRRNHAPPSLDDLGPMTTTSQGFHHDVTPKSGRGGHKFSATTSPRTTIASTYGSPTNDLRPGTGRFRFDELQCFGRLPQASPLCKDKAEIYWEKTGLVRQALSEKSLHQIPAPKGDFWKLNKDELGVPEHCLPPPPPPEPDPVELLPPMLPGEVPTASVLQQIYPSSTSPIKDPAPKDKQRKPTRKKSPTTVPHGPSDVAQSGSTVNNPNVVSHKLLQFRARMLDKFMTMKNAFDLFCNDGKKDHNNATMARELGRKEFHRFLSKHFVGLTKEEHDKIFEFLDTDKSGTISLSEFHTAIEAAAPVRTLEDFRRRMIALGWSSVRQALLQMVHYSYKDSSASITMSTFGQLLTRIGIQEEDEHLSIYVAVTGEQPDGPGSTITIDQLSCGLAAVSPSLLLEDIRERLLKKYGSFPAAYLAMDQFADDLDPKDFLRYCTAHFKMTPHESQKAFRLIDIDGSGTISRLEFLGALRLCEPSLFHEEVRRKVRQRFRSMCEAFAAQGQEPVRRKDAFAEEKGDHAALEKVKGAMTKAFQQDVDDADKGMKSPIDFDHILQGVQLSSTDTRMLFDLIDINKDGTLTVLEFIRGLKLFAPSCCIQDLRLQCLNKFGTIPDAFKSVPPERRDAVMDVKAFSRLLADLDLQTDVSIDQIFDLVETRRNGGITIGELIAALLSAAPGAQVPVPPEQRNARAKMQIQWQLAPFHRSAIELRSHVREKAFREDQDDMNSSTTIVDQRSSTSKSFRQTKSTGSLQQQQVSSPEKSKSTGSLQQQQVSSPEKSDEGPGDKRRGTASQYEPVGRSYRKMGKLLVPMPAADSRRIVDNLGDYYHGAGRKLGDDVPLLANTRSPFGDWRGISKHRKLLEPKLPVVQPVTL